MAQRSSSIRYTVSKTLLGLQIVLLCAAGCKSSQPSQYPQTKTVASQAASPSPANSSSAHSGSRNSRRGRANLQASPGDFDFYLLNLSWSPEFCATHMGSPECGRGLGFVVHGMWPQYASGDYPEHCSDAPGPSRPENYTDLIPTASLVEHEWETHGTCSGLQADSYFAAIRRAVAQVRIPAQLVAQSEPVVIAPREVLAEFANANPQFPSASFALSCGNNRLTAIEVCLSKDLQPESCQGVRSCGANAIRVTPKAH
jgi:ribonuclease T2